VRLGAALERAVATSASTAGVDPSPFMVERAVEIDTKKAGRAEYLTVSAAHP
jgi:hypothetical protein